MKTILALWTFIALSVSFFQLFSFSAFADQSVTLAWDPSPDPDVQGTIVHYGPSSRNYTNRLHIGPVTRTTVAGLLEGATYYFAVTVTNSIGLESEYSNEVSTNIPAFIAHAPTITRLPDLEINEDAATALLPFQIWDIDSNVTNLTMTAASSNPALVKPQKIYLGGDGPHRTVNIVPEPDQSGQTTITLTVSDGARSSSSAFVLTVKPVFDAPRQLVFRSTIQVSTSVDGPWTNLVTTILPVPLESNLFYRTWGSVKDQ